MFHPDKPHIELMEKLNSSYRFVHKDNKIRVELIDLHTKRVWETAEGASEPDAFGALMDKARGLQRPATPAELAEENQKLKAELARLKGEPQEESGPPQSEPPTPLRRRPRAIIEAAQAT